jgi:hypothetical protein
MFSGVKPKKNLIFFQNINMSSDSESDDDIAFIDAIVTRRPRVFKERVDTSKNSMTKIFYSDYA